MNENLQTLEQASAAETMSAAKVEACETTDVNQRVWRTSAAAIMIIGAFLRLYDLNLVPLHHDEGVNGNFLVQLVSNGFYQYDPQNYHGPTLYYFAALIPWISKFLFGTSFVETYGLSTFTIRFVTAAFGIATVWLVLTLRRRIGTIAALAGAALLAISPGAVYLSRYFIHETLLVFFILSVVVASLCFYESMRPSYLLLAAASAALAFATKETAIISAGVLLMALGSTIVMARLRKIHEGQSNAGNGRGKLATLQERVRSAAGRFGGPLSLAILSIAALSLFLTIEILFYSSFFTNYPKGLYDSLKTFEFWARTGTRDHSHPWSTYFTWMFKEESPLMLLGSAGTVLALWRGSNRFAVFAAFWALGTLAAYSLIPYKTPWLMLNFLVPLAITGGYAFEEIYKQGGARKPPLV
ncbi:MAG: flippase activity-associated protein Agl23, partial [bacterium]